jgi:hypothetical protein
VETGRIAIETTALAGRQEAGIGDGLSKLPEWWKERGATAGGAPDAEKTFAGYFL